MAELTRRLGAGLAAYASFSGEIHGLFGDVNDRLNALASTCSSSVVPGSFAIRFKECFVFWVFLLGFCGVLDFEKLNWLLLCEDGGRGQGDDGKGGKGFREELAALAKEVARLETVRVYAGWLLLLLL